MALILVPLAGAQSYTVTDLGVITGGDETIPAAIDNHGWVAGHAYTNSEPYAFLWTPTEGIRNLGTLPGGIESFALGVNDSGTVVGFSGAESGNSAFLWTQKGGMQNLGTLGGGSIEVSANGINNSGQVVGYAVLADNTTTHAFLWTQAGGMQDLGTLGGDYSAAYAINDAGEVVGKSLLPGNPSIYHAFLWTQAGGMQDLGALGEKQQITTGLAINDQGTVVGSSGSYELTSAFVWTQSHGIRSLGAGESVASGINDAGEVVGGYGAVDNAFVWTPTQRLQNLNNLYSTKLRLGAGAGRGDQPVGADHDNRNDWRPVPRRSFDSHELAQAGSLQKSRRDAGATITAAVQ
jgi:probable HAF family extracellular repeat protein